MVKFKLCYLLAKTCDDYKAKLNSMMCYTQIFNISFHHNEKIIT